MADWDEDSPQFRENLAGVFPSARNDAVRRAKPTIETVRAWHKDMMHKLSISKAEYGRFTDHAVGRFRGEIGLEGCDVEVGGYDGVESSLVAGALKSFEETLQDAVQSLDDLIAPGQELDDDQLAAVIELCAWLTPNGQEFTPSLMAMAAPPGCGLTISPCVTVCRISCA